MPDCKMRVLLNVFLICLIATCQLSSASAEVRAETETVTPEGWLLLRAQPFVREGRNVGAAQTKLMEIFYRADLDGGGVSASDVKLAEEMAAAQRRAAQAMQWLAHDLDRDGKVTRAELEATLGAKAHEPLRSEGRSAMAPSEEQAAKILQRLMSKAMRLDTDGDGSIMIGEMLVQQEDEMSFLAGRSDRQLPSGLDADKDGVITRDEFGAAVGRALASVDTDGSGAISNEEAAAFSVRQREIAQAVQAAEAAKLAAAVMEFEVKRCAFPAAPPDAEIVLLMAHEGGAVSTVALGDENAEISVADIMIEQGQKPIYLLLGSNDGMVWRVSGDVDRVTKVVASATSRAAGEAPRVGIVGIPRDRVSVITGVRCLSYFSQDDVTRNAERLSVLTAALGRKADVMLSPYQLRKIALPSGELDNTTPYPNAEAVAEKVGPAKAIWQQMLKFRPGGLVRIDPDAVVADLKSMPYSVLPQQAGLAQLVESGALSIVAYSNPEIIGRRRTDQIVVVPEGTKQIFVGAPSEFVILKKMRFPAGLTGAHAVHFLLAPGVPLPDGDPGHSCVIDKESGKRLGRVGC